jgi:hypothetical protein
MATDIVQSLFGVTPQAYQQAQQARMDAQALQYAKLDPFQQANYAIGRGANMLGGAIGGALGGQDPELQRITMRQQIAGQINPNEPASIEKGIVALQQAGDAQGAFMLQSEYQKIKESGALIGQREAAGKASLAAAGRERLQGIPNDIQLAREISSLQEQIGQFTALPASPERDQALRLASGQLAELQRLTTKEIKDPRFGTDREAIAEEIYGAPFAGLSQTQKAAVNARVEAEQGRKAAAGAARLTNVLPGAKELIDIPKFRNTVQGTIDPQLKAINATDQALEAIETSLATGNFASYRAAQTQFARAISGAGDLSQRELKAAGADPSLLGGTADYLSSLFTSTPTTDTQNKIKVTLEAIRKVAANKARTEVEQQRAIAIASPGYDPTAVTRALTFPELAPRVAAPAPGAPGGDLAAQAAAILEQRAAGKAKK